MRPNSVTDSVTFALSDWQKEVLTYCQEPKSSREILEHIGVTYQGKNVEKFIKNLVDSGLLEMSFPATPNSPMQKYVTKKDA